MQIRRPIAFLVKALFAFVVAVLLWRQPAFSGGYHRAVASAATSVSAHCIPWGHTLSIRDETPDFVSNGRQGDRNYRVRVPEGRVTANVIFLITLFAASPVRTHFRTYSIFVAGAFVGLFLLHTFTVVMLMENRLVTLPATAVSGTVVSALHFYARSYPYVGLYVVVLAIWCPYILVITKHEHGRAS